MPASTRIPTAFANIPCDRNSTVDSSVSLIGRGRAALLPPSRRAPSNRSTCLVSSGSRPAIGYNRLGNRCQDWRAGRQHHQTLRFMVELMEDHIRNHMPRNSKSSEEASDDLIGIVHTYLK